VVKEFKDLSQNLNKEKIEKFEKRVKEKVKYLHSLGFNFELEETPDTFILKIKDEDGNDARKIYLTKLQGVLPVKDKFYKIEDIIEALLNYPYDSIQDAVEKFFKQSN